MTGANDGESANPLLTEWLKQKWDEARERNSKGCLTYRKAYEAMRACPLPFDHPSQAIQLNGIGPKLCSELTKRLEDHCLANGLPAPQKPVATVPKRKASENADEAKKARKVKAYVPSLRTGPYALVKALSSAPEDELRSYTKVELIDLAQPFCESSFSVPSEAGKFYTAWNSMTTLVNKDLVQEHGRPLRKYTLTDEGWEVAKRIRKAEYGDTTKSGNSGNSIITQTTKSKETSGGDRPAKSKESKESAVQSIKSTVASLPEAAAPGKSPTFFLSDSDSPEPSPKPDTRHLPQFKPLILRPGSFDVHIVLDNREVRSREDRDYIAEQLKHQGTPPMVRPLAVGDIFWVAKVKDRDWLARHGEVGDELALDWIVERKRLDDLVSSITDGRFQEQKFRLRRSGTNHVIYLIEDFSLSAERSTRFGEAITSAIASTQVVNGYFVKRTVKLDESIRYLARLTKMLKQKYESRPLRIIPSSILTPTIHLPLMQALRTSRARELDTLLPDHESIASYHISEPSFASLASKSDVLTLRDVFLRMLMCTRGVSADKALAIQRQWSTPRALVEAYQACASERERAMLMETHLGSLMNRGKIKGVLSSKVAEIWS